MRVLLAMDGLGPGGAERRFCLLCSGLARLGTGVLVQPSGSLSLDEM